ncbi:hypothetical protein [Okeania sp. SIO3I5]|uniref:hypothetical protein n=1 Tax=Okeania sp. SIO3I5 TaxID=2607805 RepID=UPI0025CC2D9C|nr:hypothetical protein [Okeania sp. SIO3I5]
MCIYLSWFRRSLSPLTCSVTVAIFYENGITFFFKIAQELGKFTFKPPSVGANGIRPPYM